MKTRNLFAAALIAAVAFTACSNEDEIVTKNDPNIVSFRTSVDGMPMTRASINGDGTGQFDDGDVWGIYGKITSPESWPLDNSQYTVGTTTLYWDDISMDKPVTFSAYFPAVGNTVSDPSAFEFDVAGAFWADLLVATPVTASKGETVNLNFKHVMHQLILSFSKEAGVSGNLADIEFSLLNMKSTAKVNLLDGTVDPSQTTGTTDYSKYVYWEQPFVAPQDLTAGADWIEVELDGKTYTCKVPANLNPGNSSHPTRLESGKQLSLTLTLKASPSGRTEVTISSTQISGWGNQGSVNGDANE